MEKHLSKLEQFTKLSAPKVSFEFFPPKTPEATDTLWKVIKELEELSPEFVSVTYGAGGTTREYTHKTVEYIKNKTSLTPAAHLTCVGATKEEVNEVARGYWDIGVRHIVALRGDPPEGQAKYTPYPGGYEYSVDLVKGLKEIADFEISVASFPETHPEAESQEKDLEYLKRKIDAGASRTLTQYFFDTGLYLSFRERAVAAGVSVPIVPGILLITNFKQMVNFSKRCGATVPEWLGNLLNETDETPEKRDIISAIIASEQCRILREEGVEQFHFYTLNRPTLAKSVCHILGIR